MENKTGIVVEKYGNLFTAPISIPIAHCIAIDCGLGAGIAKVFSAKFPTLQNYLKTTVKKQNLTYPCVVPYQATDGRLIFNLIDKPISTKVPIRADLNIVLVKLYAKLKEKNIKIIAMPKIGAGLDKLNWEITRLQLVRLSKKYGIKTIIYKL
ncbi:hypothetical protein ACQW5G_00585 [Fructilactobacillus sp. Tb1]|uniref:hypothetical protein n=1 Tax=Fructilactobacillus sp. Tb1 TaxID=3422304 RepID=UPI003D2BED9F